MKTLLEEINDLTWWNEINKLKNILKRLISTFISDAPTDGNTYARKDAEWVEQTASSGIESITGDFVNNTDPLNPIIEDPRPYKVYTALLSQSGTNAPTAIVLENTLGVDVSFTYFLAANYFINAIGAFTGNKTYVDVGQSIYATSAYIIIPSSPNIDQVQIRVTKVTDNTSSDNKLTNFPIEIRVYS